MKKVCALLLALIFVLSLVACGGGEKKDDTSADGGATEAAETGLTADTCIGTWVMNDELSKNPNSAPPVGQIIELFKGGTGKGYADENQKNKGSYYPLSWEIKEDCLIVSMTADPLSSAFELVDNNLVTTDGEFTLVKSSD